MTVINVLLLVTALCGSIAAFGGETWKKGDEPLLKRITRRGWVALTVFVLAFALGASKEYLTREAAEEAALATVEKEKDLRRALDEANAEVRRLKPALENALKVATAGIPRDLDFPYYQGRSGEPRGAVMSNSGGSLQVLAGQRISWMTLSPYHPNAFFVIGGRRYHLDRPQGEIIVVGRPGEFMDVLIEDEALRSTPPGFPLSHNNAAVPLQLKMVVTGSAEPSQLLAAIRQQLATAATPTSNPGTAPASKEAAKK